MIHFIPILCCVLELVLIIPICNDLIFAFLDNSSKESSTKGPYSRKGPNLSGPTSSVRRKGHACRVLECDHIIGTSHGQPSDQGAHASFAPNPALRVKDFTRMNSLEFYGSKL